jgi:hypothetical protein
MQRLAPADLVAFVEGGRRGRGVKNNETTLLRFVFAGPIFPIVASVTGRRSVERSPPP